VSRPRPAARASRRRRCACNQAHKEQHSLPPQLESPVQRAAEEAPAERIRAQAVQRPCCARARALLVCDCRRAASWRALRSSCQRAHAGALLRALVAHADTAAQEAAEQHAPLTKQQLRQVQDHAAVQDVARCSAPAAKAHADCTSHGGDARVCPRAAYRAGWR